MLPATGELLGELADAPPSDTDKPDMDHRLAELFFGTSAFMIEFANIVSLFGQLHNLSRWPAN